MTTNHQTTHGEHRLWESEISLWRDDLRAWQHELAKAQSEIKQLEHALEQHAHTLRQHGAAIRLQEQTFNEHEHAIVEYEKGGEGDDLFEFARQHREEVVHQAEKRAAHEQLKRRHRNIIAHWTVLLKTLREPAEQAGTTAPKSTIVSS
jgi:hypothetical protein